MDDKKYGKRYKWDDFAYLYSYKHLNINEIAQLKGCCHASVGYALDRLAIRPRPKKHLLNEERIRQLYIKEELSASGIADRLGEKLSSVTALLNRLSISRSRTDARNLSIEKGRDTKRTGTDNPFWKGGRTNKRGYNLVQQKDHPRAYGDGYILEHILVWEEYHQSPVPKGYEIHHLNGIKTDNRPQNLLALPSKKHSLIIPKLKERIRQQEIEIRQLRRALEDSQSIFYVAEN